MQDQVARYKPGDKITLTYVRAGKENTTTVTLKNKAGTYTEVKAESAIDKLGAELANLDASTAKKNDITGGVVVKKIGNGILKRTRMQEGFVITSVNGQPVNNIDELKSVLGSIQGTAKIEGIYPGYEGSYAYPLNLSGTDNKGGDNGDQ